MSSMAQMAYDIGIIDINTGDLNMNFFRNCCDNYDDYCDDDEPDYFETWQEARDYAKANPGTKIARCDDGRGWEIKK